LARCSDVWRGCESKINASCALSAYGGSRRGDEYADRWGAIYVSRFMDSPNVPFSRAERLGSCKPNMGWSGSDGSFGRKLRISRGEMPGCRWCERIELINMSMGGSPPAKRLPLGVGKYGLVHCSGRVPKKDDRASLAQPMEPSLPDPSNMAATCSPPVERAWEHARGRTAFVRLGGCMQRAKWHRFMSDYKPRL